MPYYLVPQTGDITALADVASRARIKLATPTTVREVIIEMNDSEHIIISLSPQMLTILNRHADELMIDVPSVIITVPDLLYTAEWMMAASPYHALDWVEFKSKLEKSGFTAHEVDQISKSDRGVTATAVDELPGDVVNAVANASSLADLRRRSQKRDQAADSTHDGTPDGRIDPTIREELDIDDVVSADDLP